MNTELVRFKYKKDIIKCIEESWDYYGEEDEQRRVIKELENVYKIASSAKNAPKPEYEAKAKAFDEIMFTEKNVKRDTPFNTTVRNIVRQYEKEYESGESE